MQSRIDEATRHASTIGISTIAAAAAAALEFVRAGYGAGYGMTGIAASDEMLVTRKLVYTSGVTGGRPNRMRPTTS